MAEKKMCPHCGSQMFMVKIVRAGLAEFTTDPNEPCKVLKESKDKFDIEIVGCARCKEAVAETDLVTGVKCKECGRVVGPMDVNADGICNVCEAVKQRTELASASREDLIKMLLDAEKKVNPVAAKMEKQIEKADVAPATVPDVTNAPMDINDILDAPAEEQPAEKKKTRTKSRKKKDDAVDESATETTEEAEATEEVVEETEQNTEGAKEAPVVTEEVVDDIANQQEAPFPDIAMNPPVEEVTAPSVPVVEQPAQDGEQPIGADFRMFDEEEEAF